MTGQSPSSADTERRTDGGLDPGEMEEHPAETVYHNLQDMSRRQFLTLTALGGAGYTAWTTDVDGDGVANGEELLQGRNPVGAGPIGGDGGGASGGAETPRQTGIREKALQYTQDRYPEYTDAVQRFIGDDDVADRFIDEQLRLWIGAPAEWQQAIVAAEDGLYRDDWTKNGVHHLAPDGAPGPAYESPFVINPDGDAFMPRFYNATGRVHDIETGEYRGFQRDEGDRVGKHGDAQGEGSIAAYLDGDVSREQLTGHAISVVWHDWMDGTTSKGPNEHEEYSGRLRPETKRLVEQVFSDAPIQNPDGTTGVDIHWIEGESISHEDTTTPEEANQYADQHINDELKGVVNYALVTHDLLWPDHPEGVSENPTGLTLSLNPGDGGMWEVTTDVGAERNDYSRARINASTLLHEVYGHGVADLPHAGANPQVDEDTNTVMDEFMYLGFAPSEWERVVQGMSPRNKGYYRPTGDTADITLG